MKLHVLIIVHGGSTNSALPPMNVFLTTNSATGSRTVPTTTMSHTLTATASVAGSYAATSASRLKKFATPLGTVSMAKMKSNARNAELIYKARVTLWTKQCS